MTAIAVSKYACFKKIPPGASVWSKFNASFENKDLSTTEIMDVIYKGYPVTTQHKNAWRTSENYLCGQHLALDFDSEDTQSTIPFLMKDKFIQRYGAFIHTTISHTPEKPRARVFFVLDQPIMQAKNYTAAAAALLWLFGTADRQCKDAVRFFYGAPNCTMEMIGNILDLETVKKLIANYQETGQIEKHQASKKEYLVPPSQQEVAEALNFIPPWGIDYDEWVQVLMGIHSAFGQEGYQLAENWADGKQGEVKQKWQSFHEAGNTTGQITVATVFGIAKKYGWKKLDFLPV